MSALNDRRKAAQKLLKRSLKKQLDAIPAPAIPGTMSGVQLYTQLVILRAEYNTLLRMLFEDEVISEKQYDHELVVRLEMAASIEDKRST